VRAIRVRHRENNFHVARQLDYAISGRRVLNRDSPNFRSFTWRDSDLHSGDYLVISPVERDTIAREQNAV